MTDAPNKNDPDIADKTAPQPAADQQLDDATIARLTLHFQSVQTTKKEQETGFDKSVLIVAGGAFTVSAAFVPQLDGELTAGWALGMAWVAWAACLVLSIYAFLFSTDCHDWVLKRMAAGETDFDKLHCEKADWIPWMNRASFALLVIGFVGFGIFTFANLDFEGEPNGEGKKESQEEGLETRVGQRRIQEDRGVGPAGSDAGVATTQEDQQQVGERNSAQNNQAAGTAERTEARSVQGTGAGPSDDRKVGAESATERDASATPATGQRPPDSDRAQESDRTPTYERRHDSVERARPAPELGQAEEVKSESEEQAR